MNIYLCVSEDLGGCYSTLGIDPPEPYVIAQIVNARNASQAKYLAWKSDKKSESDIREMPKFRCELKIKDSGIKEAKVITDIIEKLANELEFDGIYGYLWSFREDLMVLDDKWKELLNG